MEKIRLGIVRETKNPPDRRVPLTPIQCRLLLERFPQLEIQVQPSPIRCYSDEEYRKEGLQLVDDLGGCDILAGVKEVKIDALIPDKTYLFFSHTAKEQPYNRGLLQAIVERRIRLLDYEYLTDEKGVRVVAFGRWAGVVGAYNALRALGIRRKALGRQGFDLPAASENHDYAELMEHLKGLELGKTRFCITGGGRVAGGALEVMKAAGIAEVSPGDYLGKDYPHAVFTRLDPLHYTKRMNGAAFEFGHFVEHPDEYANNFLPYARCTDVYIACHFWDPRAPFMMTRKDMASGEVPISVVADISCDLAGPVPSTIRASTIAEPYYGYDPVSGKETDAFVKNAVTVMAVDNLPGELPRDASADFGEAMMAMVVPELLGEKDSGMLERACITEKGSLCRAYDYLQDYLAG